jgi:hypothetical protein
LLQLSETPEWEEVIDGLEVVDPVGPKDARFQLVTGGLQIPTCSFVSRTNDDVWFIDTGVDFDGGRMYVGKQDFDGMASVAGYVSKASVGRVYEENERLRGELVLAKSLIADLRVAVAGLVGASTMEASKGPRTTEPAHSVEPEPRRDETNTSDLDLDSL